MLFEFTSAKCPSKKAAFVSVRLNLDDEGSSERSFDESHVALGFAHRLLSPIAPKEIMIDLAGADEILELF